LQFLWYVDVVAKCEGGRLVEVGDLFYIFFYRDNTVSINRSTERQISYKKRVTMIQKASNEEDGKKKVARWGKLMGTRYKCLISKHP
jgi:hypothetical protein